MAIKTLAQLNGRDTSTREWDSLTLESFYAVGRIGRSRSGEKIHLLRCERVVADSKPPVPGRRRVRPGDLFSAYAIGCNTNGQHIGSPMSGRGFDTEAVSCAKCRARLELISRDRVEVPS